MKNSKLFQSKILNWKLISLNFFVVSFLVGYQIIVMTVLNSPPTIRGLLTFAIDVIAFYINLYWIVPLFIKDHKQREILLRVIILVLVHYIICSLLAYNKTIKTNFFNFALSTTQIILRSWQLSHLLLYGFITGFFQIDKYRSEERQRLELANIETIAEKERIENTLIQMQLNRHTIFNGLSYIKSHTEEALPDVGNTVGLFAEIVRYSMLDIRKIHKVPISDEVNQIKNHIAFHEHLSDKKFVLDLTINLHAEADQFLIPPSLLITIADNMLRYGILHDPVYPATLSIATTKDSLIFKTFNSKKRRIIGGNGMGISSVQSILAYYYEGKHEIEIIDLEETYELCLKIQL